MGTMKPGHEDELNSNPNRCIECDGDLAIDPSPADGICGTCHGQLFGR